MAQHDNALAEKQALQGLSKLFLIFLIHVIQYLLNLLKKKCLVLDTQLWLRQWAMPLSVSMRSSAPRCLFMTSEFAL